MVRFFLEGGFGMYLILPVGLVALGLAIAAAAAREARLRTATIGALGIVALLGVTFWMLGRSQVERAVGGVENPADAELIVAQGYHEAARPLQLAGGFLLVGGALAAIAFARKEPS